MLKIGFLLCDRMLATSLTLPTEMLLAAESAWQQEQKIYKKQIDIKLFPYLFCMFIILLFTFTIVQLTEKVFY